MSRSESCTSDACTTLLRGNERKAVATSRYRFTCAGTKIVHGALVSQRTRKVTLPNGWAGLSKLVCKGSEHGGKRNLGSRRPIVTV